ncbi:MAG: hypothetical protein WAV80_00515, partial [Blautia wexlerae]
ADTTFFLIVKILHFFLRFSRFLDNVTIAQGNLDMVGKKQDILRKTKNALHRTGHFCCKIMLYTDLLLHLQKQPDNL